LEGELGHYKASNQQLQFEIEKEKYFNGLAQKDNRYFKERIRELIAQNEELKTERQKMDQYLLERDEEILQLKNHNQNLLVKIKSQKTRSKRIQIQNKKIEVSRRNQLKRRKKYPA
jgi:predicted RNase H-like nuclease (RuvC/YqgF family)